MAELVRPIPCELHVTPEVRRQLGTRLRTHVEAGLDLLTLSLVERGALDPLLTYSGVWAAVLEDLGL